MATAKKETAEKKPAAKKETAAKKPAAKKDDTAAKPAASAKTAAKKPAAPKKEAAPKKAAAPKSDKPLAARLVRVVDAPVGGKIKVTQTIGTIARKSDQQATLKGLGLNKRHRSRVLEDTAAVRGMIYKVRHLVEVEKVS